MKNNITKILSIVLIISTVLSFSSCDFWNDTPPDDEMLYLEDFCYSITTDKETYSYGDEIEITLSLQFSRRRMEDGLNYIIYLEESPFYEMLGEREYLFVNINERDYSCSDGAEKRFLTKFKVKIDEPTYTTQAFKFAVACYSEEDKENESNWFIRTLRDVFYIGDLQGIMIHQMPYSYNHFDGEGHWTPRPHFSLGQKEILVASYNREYQAGVSVEELIDRYVRDDYDMKNRIFYYGSSTESEDYSCEYYYLSYVSSGVRFKIYLPKDNECVKLYKERSVFYATNDEAVKEYLEKLLSFALENGAITEEEYTAEISYIFDGEEDVVVQGHAYLKIIPSEGNPTKLWEMQDELAFTVPTGDDYYNRVINVEN